MDKRAIEKYAQETRVELIESIKKKAYEYGIEEYKIIEPEITQEDSIIIRNKEITGDEKAEYKKLVGKIDKENYKESYNKLIDEVAYTWFNRITGIRYLEVNGYLDHGIRVLSSVEEGKNTPDIMEQVLNIDFDIEKEKYFDLLDNSNDNEMFKYILIKQCNMLSEKLPFLFESENDYSELLIPDGLLDPGSIIKKLISDIPEENFKDVEIIGWLYQYYISELKDKNIKKKKYKKEDMPSVTQLFTPHWIVQYMVQNSLGKLWLESHPDQESLKEDWDYYLEPVEQTEEVQKKLDEIIDKDLKLEDITFLDPACGSGHILVYAFELFYEMYKKRGYNPRVIVKKILQNNLYGLDIDKRATQLAKFALMMKARNRDRRILNRDIELNITPIEESNGLDKRFIDFFLSEDSEVLNDADRENFKELLETYKDAKMYGSILKVGDIDFKPFEDRIEEIEKNKIKLALSYNENIGIIRDIIKPMIQQTKIMNKKYDVVVTNPPYGGSKKLPKELKEYFKENYKKFKKDIFSVFIKRNLEFTKEGGHLGFMTPFVWMFISSYEKLRKYMIDNKNITSLIQLEYSGFSGATVPICTFTLRNSKTKETGQFVKLSDFKGAKNQPIKTREAASNPDVDYRYTAKTEDFKKIPGGNIGYWASSIIIDAFEDFANIETKGDFATGLQTGKNNLFLKYWFEVFNNKINYSSNSLFKFKWMPHVKGGGYRKWYGNHEYVIMWKENGKSIKKHPGSVIRNERYYLKPGLTWSHTTSGSFAMRFLPSGFIFNVEAPSVFNLEEKEYYLGLLNSNIVGEILSIMNESMHYLVGDLKKIPVKLKMLKLNVVNELVTQNINISKKDWDSLETSWNFEIHPIIEFKENAKKMEKAFNGWSDFAEKQFNQLWKNEEELNRIFIEIYGLENELTPDVKEKDITVRKADFERDIKSFISYGVGCIMGRYSLDEEGLAYAGGEFDSSKYSSFIPDEDGIITILDRDYFDNDIVRRFVEFVKVTFGEEHLEENLSYIASALKPRKSETSRETLRRYFETGSKFYKKHCQIYNKRPIYWKVSSGGRNPSFMALIYLHRYDEDTLSTLRVKYLHEFQRKLKQEREHLEGMLLEEIDKREKSQYESRISDINSKLDDLIEFDEKLGYLADQRIKLDLDDGVKENYKKLKDVLDKIR